MDARVLVAMAIVVILVLGALYHKYFRRIAPPKLPSSSDPHLMQLMKEAARRMHYRNRERAGILAEDIMRKYQRMLADADVLPFPIPIELSEEKSELLLTIELLLEMGWLMRLDQKQGQFFVYITPAASWYAGERARFDATRVARRA